RYQEPARDLRGGEAAQEPERQSNLSAGGERRMTAGEDQAQPVVAHWALLGPLTAGVQQSGLRVPVLLGGLLAEAVDRPVTGGGDNPSRRARGQPGGWPPLHRRGERVLDRLLGDVDVAEHASDLGGGDGRHGRYQPSVPFRNDRTSIGSVVTRLSLRPHSSAESRSGALMMVNPPRYSLPSANGPSVVSTSLPCSRTTVAVLDACSPPEKTHAPAALSSWFRASSSAEIFARTSGAGSGPSG